MSAIAYLRVSTKKQAKSSLGLESQQRTIKAFCEREGIDIIDTFTEVESGGKNDRPMLKQAMAKATEMDIPIIVMKLCRLSRDVEFIAGLMKSKISFIITEFGNQKIPSFVLHVLSAVAEEQRRQISINTKNSLAVAKAKGIPLGTHNPRVRQGRWRQSQDTNDRVFPYIRMAIKEGFSSLREISWFLNEKQIKTPRGKDFTKANLSPIMKRFRLETNIVKS
tara:strand:- start:412 stop:1077 length:666 start_codon:yes stop_codon:yes gene_type:complete